MAGPDWEHTSTSSEYAHARCSSNGVPQPPAIGRRNAEACSVALKAQLASPAEYSLRDDLFALPAAALHWAPRPGPPAEVPPGHKSCCSSRTSCTSFNMPSYPHPNPHPIWPRFLGPLALLLIALLCPTAARPKAASSSSSTSSLSITGTQLRLELDLRQLQQAVASTGFVGNTPNPTNTTSLLAASSNAVHAAAAVNTTTSHPSGPFRETSFELPGDPAELTFCLNTHQPDIKGTRWEDAMHDHPGYLKVVGLWWSRKRADVPVTITTQLSWNRKWQLKAMCRSWQGPIAAVMHMPVLLPRLTRRRDGALSDVSNATLQHAVDTVAAFHARLDASQPCKLDLMLLAEPYRDGKSLVLYPVNTLRNYARLMARTPLIGLVDVDLIVSSNLRGELLNTSVAATYAAEAAAAAATAHAVGPHLSTGASRCDGVPKALATQLNMTPAAVGTRAHGPRAAWVLPAFETRGGAVAVQVARAEKLAAKGNKALLRTFYQYGKVQRFDWGSTGHKNTDYGKWFNTTEPYVVEWSDRYEPWVVVDRLSSSWADARFRGYGKNKISHIRTLAYDGYELRVHPSAFLIHRPHLESSSSYAHARGAMHSKAAKTSSMYGHNVHLYKAVAMFMAYGNYTPVVDPATEACRRKLSWWQQEQQGP